jgi:hypothetical protein
MKIGIVGVQGVKYHVYVNRGGYVIEAYKEGKNITSIKTLKAIQAVIDSKEKMDDITK